MPNNSTVKIAKLIPYYGSWPSYFNIYNETCKRNQNIDIIFLTDIPPYEGAAPNIRFVYMTFEQLKKRISDTLGVDASGIIPYKLCDFRPAYGLIFAEYIKGYDFWGYGDIDLIYGDTRKFLTDDVLANNDFIAFQERHLHGPFSLYRNNDFINNIFKRYEGYMDVFQNPNYVSFDEFGTSRYHIGPERDLDTLPNDAITLIALKAQKKGELKIYLKMHVKEYIYVNKEIVKYDKGILTNYATGEEYFFYHWVIEKRALWFQYPDWKEVPDTYYVSETGFYSPQDFKTFGLRTAYRKTVGFIKWMDLKISNYIKRRTGKKVKIDTYPQVGFVKSL